MLSSRTLRAEPLDLAGRPCAGLVEFDWYLAGLSCSRLEPSADGATATLHTVEELTPGFVRVIATQDLTRVDATAEITIVESLDRGGSLEVIPAPVLIEDAHGAWRSRWLEERWEVNAGLADYMASSGTSTLRLRYLALLFAKEVVLKSAGDPRL